MGRDLQLRIIGGDDPQLMITTGEMHESAKARTQETVLQEVKQLLTAFDGRDVIPIHLNSSGGTALKAFAIRRALLECQQEKTIRIEGMCHSAATLLLLKEARITATPDSLFQFHYSRMDIKGRLTVERLNELAQRMMRTRRKMLEIYKQRMTIPEDEILALMRDEKLLMAEGARNIGLIDEITE